MSADIYKMALRKRENLFLGTLEEFRFDFEGADDAAATADDDGGGGAPHPKPEKVVAAAIAPLGASEVLQLLLQSQKVGCDFFSLPAAAGSFDDAVGQFHTQLGNTANQLRKDARSKDTADPKRGHVGDGDSKKRPRGAVPKS